MHASVAALTVLSCVFSLDFLSARRSKPNQTRFQSDDAEATVPKQKRQPHIIFILTDDQASVKERVCASSFLLDCVTTDG